MTDKTCPFCRGLGWVCENHPLRVWSDKLGGCRCGEGMPCACNTAEDPEIRVVIVEADTTWH